MFIKTPLRYMKLFYRLCQQQNNLKNEVFMNHKTSYNQSTKWQTY